MTTGFFLKGVAIGFAIAAPVGPIGVLCIRRTLAGGFGTGFVTGLGAATADAAYGSVAAFGLTAVSNFLTGQQFWLGLVGGIFLCYLGIRTFVSKPAELGATVQTCGRASAYLSTVLLTLANPATILSFVAVFAGFGLGASPDYPAASALVLGVFAGSALWWLILSAGMTRFRSRMTISRMRVVNRLSGCILFAFGFRVLPGLMFK
jgi:threonine/homoserine/homoserine lactone efflux protein